MNTVGKTILLCGVLLVGSAGCSSGDGPLLAEATGTVTHNGKPLPQAKVVFTSEDGVVAIGTTDDQGRFELQTRGRPGAAIGKNAVAVTANERIGGKTVTEDGDSGEAAKQVRSRIPKKYSHHKTSGLSFEVAEDPSANNFEIKLVD